jgi:hypothetical protein
MLRALGTLFLLGVVAAIFGTLFSVVAISLGVPDTALTGVVAGESAMFLVMVIVGKANE